jgi:hypothetical protein
MLAIGRFHNSVEIGAGQIGVRIIGKEEKGRTQKGGQQQQQPALIF